MDKFLDPSFFDAASPASIFGQLTEFARVSPLAPLVRIVEPFALPLGLLIALAEIAIGLGALTGLAFRLSAMGGALLSLLFFLTASWTTHPYYYGPDLPYAFGWLALALAGDGGLLVPRAVREIGKPAEDDWPITIRSAGRRLRDSWLEEEEVSPARRQLLQAGVLGAAALAVASLAVPLRIMRPRTLDDAQVTGAGGNPPPNPAGGSAAPSSAPLASTAPGESASLSPTTPPTAAPAAGLTVAKISDVNARGAVGFQVPVTAPAPLPAGDPGILIKLADGTYVAYDAVCTHQGCSVGWDARDGVILCPCHGAAFDPANHAAVLGGPTNTPLMELPLVIDKQTGTISLKT